jgi:hypothetical protein
MNTTVLIEAIVRQTTVLLASLATASGQRAPLSNLANQVFVDLVRELKEQGLANKVIADMFGMALRTYHARVARLSESRTDRGRSLWEAVLDHVQRHGPVLRTAVLARFSHDDEASVRGVLRDLVDSGLLWRSGKGDATQLHAAQLDASQTRAVDDPAWLENLLLVAAHRHGPLDRAALHALVPVDDDASFDAALRALVQAGTLTLEPHAGAERYRCDTCVIDFGSEAGWEAALYDHYQAVVTAMVVKLRTGQRRAEIADKLGGSTFVFEIWRGHAMADEVLGYLSDVRKKGVELRERLRAHNAEQRTPDDASAMKVVAYVGQTVIEADDGG